MKYDSTHGQFKHDVKVGAADELIVNGNKIKCIAASREGIHKLPWGEMGVEYVIDPLASLWKQTRPRATSTLVRRRS